MAKLFFRYGAMGASKTANALMVKHNYTERGLNAILLKPEIDTRSGRTSVSSRIGISSEATIITKDTDILLLVDNIKNEMDLHCVIVDEAQFLSKIHISSLCTVVDTLDIPVICYGLRTDFQGELFEGSQWLLAWSDSIEEIKTICWCESKAIMNMRKINDVPTFSGDKILIGGNDSYEAVCRKHFIEEGYKYEKLREEKSF
jgi:thymidine kinase